MSMIKRGVASRGGITSYSMGDLSKCPQCGKHISIKTAKSNGSKCPYCQCEIGLDKMKFGRTQ